MNSDRSGRSADGPFDEAADITQEFWGTTRGWVPRRPGEAGDDGDDTAATRRPRRAGWSGLRAHQPDRSAQRVGRTRQHGIVRPGDAAPAPRPPQPPRSEFDSGWPLDDWTDDWSSDDWATAHAYREPAQGYLDDHVEGELDDSMAGAHDVPLTPSRQVAPLAERLGVGAVDPLLLRLGVLILIGVLMAPLALALRSDDGGSIRTGPAPIVAAAYGSPVAGPSAAATPEPAATEPATTELVAVDDAAASAANETETAAPAASSTEAPAVGAPSTTTARAPETTSTEAPVTMAADQNTTESVAPAVATEEAERIVPACPQQYEASPGDSWYRIAEAAGISPGELFAENGATAQTVILPGDSICLPADATIPAPLAPPTTQPPATTAPPTTVASAPPTTKAPASTVPPSKSEVEQIIRDVWPDELEDKALEVAWRESKYQPGAYNGWCCYGLFQIHWGAHKGWLATIDIDSTADLLDARRNTEVAYLIYQRSGGWGPWGG